MSLKQQLEADYTQRKNWALRRQLGIPNNRRLWVCACMDERLPVDEALGIRGDRGDAHVFRNAGGLITDDAIRSAMLTCQFFGTQEIVIINHTECGMMSAHMDTLVNALKDQGIDLDNIPVDPSLPELKLDAGAFGKWIRLFDNVDDICAKQVEYVRNHPLIPNDVTVSGWIWEVETSHLRPPHGAVSGKVNTSREMGAK
ncbi:beta-class carbonic anhydrase [Nitrosococcus wardiae]|uniref:Carbonic anhydrase n=1 Tax=Nitrosococcus wardiae TaxID=1814290 RepID=A0A4P7BWW5_9GAMM|nr:carbonic anhydrase [Nitrosococcus wardiae]QBQ54598.1 carbonic anhydrase [Nitrosococcus wardiae]